MINQLKIKITGKNSSLFLKEIIKNKINIYDLEKNEKEILVTINNQDYDKLRKLKTSCTIKIIKRYGLNYYKWWLKKYRLLLISWLMGISIIVLLSNMIFKVEVIHPNQKIRKIITADLRELGIQPFHFKISYQEKEKIKEKILEKEKSMIEWLEIEEIGTKYKIRVEQRKQKEKEESCNERHIVASKNAIVLEISATEGEILKRKNDYVEKGEIIISGLIYNKDKIVSKKCAKGEIYGETWYKVKVLVPKMIKEIQPLKKEKQSLTLKYFQKQISLKNSVGYFLKKEYNIIEGKIIPIKMGLSKYQKIKTIIKKQSPIAIEKKAQSLATQEITKQGKEVLEKKVLKKTEKNSKIEVEVFLKVKENITDYVDISNINIEEENLAKE